MRILGIGAFCAALGGCASTSTIPLAQDTFQITGRAAPICGAVGAEKVAFKQAAAETIRRGYDRFIIVGGQAGSEVVGSTPIVFQRTGYGGAVAYGGDSMVARNQGLIVKMLKDSDPVAANALSAFVALIISAPAPAIADYCSSPSSPSCATRYGAFDDQDGFLRCKREMESYKDEVETYLACLSRNRASAVNDYNDAVESFNRRARY
jgi:hypothetical protein